jgi:GNAT superfamily N-acetyltransferase
VNGEALGGKVMTSESFMIIPQLMANGALYVSAGQVVPTEESHPDIKVKSVFCYAIAPEMRRKGISKLLLERVCQDAARDGFDFVEAYPNKEFANEAEDYMGPAEMYVKSGFAVHYETARQFVMRKHLKSSLNEQ